MPKPSASVKEWPKSRRENRSIDFRHGRWNNLAKAMSASPARPSARNRNRATPDRRHSARILQMPSPQRLAMELNRPGVGGRLQRLIDTLDGQWERLWSWMTSRRSQTP